VTKVEKVVILAIIIAVVRVGFDRSWETPRPTRQRRLHAERSSATASRTPVAGVLFLVEGGLVLAAVTAPPSLHGRLVPSCHEGLAMTPHPLAVLDQALAGSTCDHRVLFLNGAGRRPGQKFRLRATVYVRRDGSADGWIDWRADEVGFRRTDWFGTERVGGSLTGPDVELRGLETDRGLACDDYCIHLAGGNQSGTFGGTSRAFGAWDGHMEGTYVFRDRRG
jgi:hypothetical protein